MSYLPTGTVYGTLLNFRAEFDALAAQMHEAPPKAPVLYIKPANTFTPSGGQIPVPARIAEVEIGASLGMVMGAAGEVAGYVLLNDLSVPHASFFRPPVKFKCLDGFLGVGSEVLTVDPGALQLQVRINGEDCQTVTFDALVRDAATLLADVSEFMTLGEGDVLMLGCGFPRPLAKAGDRIEISAAGLGTLANTLVGQAS